jgi:hypothetical protein
MILTLSAKKKSTGASGSILDYVVVYAQGYEENQHYKDKYDWYYVASVALDLGN